uniref:hypothetical protein n=1 Tax=Stappia indica TaxID=538381 RepID=UPI001AD8D73B
FFSSLDQNFFLLGIAEEKEELYLLIRIITAARMSFAQNWKRSEIPEESVVRNKIWACAEMDKLTLEISIRLL